MELSNKGLCELASYEGMSLTPYLDSGGEKTVGIGSTKSDIKDLPLWAWSKELSVEEAIALYRNGLKGYIAAVNRAVTLLDLPQHKFDALVSFCYNVGVGGMSGSTAIKYVNQGRGDAEVVRALKMWCKDNGKIVKGLVNRRQKESDLYVNGVYHSGGVVSVFQVDPVTHKPLYSKARNVDLMSYL